jgi:hypothetical protein
VCTSTLSRVASRRDLSRKRARCTNFFAANGCAVASV